MTVPGKLALVVLVLSILLLLFTSEIQRQAFLQNVRYTILTSIKSNANIPSIEEIPEYGNNQCTAHIENPDYSTHRKRLVDDCLLKEKTYIQKGSINLNEIRRINCEAKIALNSLDSKAPPKTIAITTPCTVISGYNKWLTVHGFRLLIIGRQEPKLEDIQKLSCGSEDSIKKATDTVRTLPEVTAYVNRLTQSTVPVVEVDNADDRTGRTWNVHVYEDVKNGNTQHTATFNWYGVDKCTGTVRCSLTKYDKTGTLIENSTDYPCN